MIRKSRSDDKASYLPSPDQIKAVAAEIRQTWSPRERRTRGNIVSHVEVTQMSSQPRRKGFWEDLLG